MGQSLLLSDLWRDIVYAFRSSLHCGQRLSSCVIVLTLAVGAAAASSVFSVVDALLIRSLPFPSPDNLVTVELSQRTDAASSLFGRAADLELYRQWRGEASDVVEVAGFQSGEATLTRSGSTLSVQVVGVTPNTFVLLGISPLHGRAFVAADAVETVRPAVLSYRLWVQLFGGDRAAVGRHLNLNGFDYRIVGVMPGGFHVPLSIPEAQQGQPELWLTTRGFRDLIQWPDAAPLPLAIIGRLRAHVSFATVEGRLTRVVQERWHPRRTATGEHPDYVTRVIGLQDARSRSVRTPLLVLSAGITLVLLLVCLNVANLISVRVLARTRELVARCAIGASPFRLVRQLTTEILVLSSIASVVGVWLALAAISVLRRVGAAYLPDIHTIQLDVRVIVFAALVAILTGITASAWSTATIVRRSPTESITGARAATTERATRSWMRTLVIFQLAFAIVILTSFGLVMRSFVRISTMVRGYDTHDVLVASLMLPGQRYPTPDSRRAFRHRLLEQLRQERAVSFPAVSSGVPVVGGTAGVVFPRERSGKGTRMALWRVEGDYFRSLGIPIVAGSDSELGASADAVAIDRAAARVLFASEAAIGRRIVWDDGKREGIVTAIVGDIQELGVNIATGSRYRRVSPHVYVPSANDASPVVRVSARLTGDKRQAVQIIREAVARIDPSLPVATLDTLESLTSVQLDRDRFLTVTAGWFALIAMLLASAGVFAVMAHSTAQRTKEIGIRLALGARPAGIMSLVLREAFAVNIIGAIAGTSCALWVSGWLDTILFETSFDGLSLAGSLALITAVSALAAATPAIRAARTDVVRTLLTQQ